MFNAFFFSGDIPTLSNVPKIHTEPKTGVTSMSTIPTKKPKDMSTKKPLDVSKIPKFTSKYTNMALSHVKGEYVMIRVCRERSFCPGQGEILRLWRQWSGRRGRSSWKRGGSVQEEFGT